MAHGDAREGKWRGNWLMEWVASTLHTTSEHGVSSITNTDAHTSAARSRLNWRPRRFKWTRPFRRKTKSGFCACAITFQTQSTSVCFLIRNGQHSILFPRKTLYKPSFTNSVLPLTLHTADCTYANISRSSLLVAASRVRQTTLHGRHSDQHRMLLQPPLQFATGPVSWCAWVYNIVASIWNVMAHSDARRGREEEIGEWSG